MVPLESHASMFAARAGVRQFLIKSVCMLVARHFMTVRNVYGRMFVKLSTDQGLLASRPTGWLNASTTGHS